MGCPKRTHFTDIELKLVHQAEALTLENTLKKAQNALELIHTPEGYMEPQGKDDFRYVYRLTDHLGNTRVSFTKNQTTEEIDILQTNDYYPFGLEHEKAGTIVNSTNVGEKFKYNGKEFNDELGLDWYDYGARMYMPELGRWGVVDKVARAMPQWSVYTYSFNNPIRFTDPDGNIPYDKTVDFFNSISHFGFRVHPIKGTRRHHNGTDLATKKGTSINSFASGTVVVTGKSDSWGNYIVVDHGQGYFSLYAHIEDEGTLVKKGQKVGDGENIAKVGSTGDSTGPHLHLEVGKAKSLAAFLSKENRDQTRTDAREIGDLEKFLHPEKGSDEKSDKNDKGYKESDIKNDKGETVGKKYENTGTNSVNWIKFVHNLIKKGIVKF